METQKLEPRYITPFGAHISDDLHVKIYHMFNPDFNKELVNTRTWLDIGEEFNALSDYLSNLDEKERYDKLGFAVISTFVPEQKKPMDGQISLALWDDVIPRRKSFEVNDKKLTELDPKDANWCVYELLGVMRFESRAWAKVLIDGKTEQSLAEYRGKLHGKGILNLLK